jgi:PAS domain S-box-containing protein
MDRKAWRSKTTALAMFKHILLNLDHVNCALFLDKQVIAVNKGWENMCGFSAAEILGKTMLLLQGPKTYEGNSLSSFTTALASGNDVIDAALINYRKDGSFFTNHVSIYCLEHDSSIVNVGTNQNLCLGFFKTNDDNATANDDSPGKENEGETKDDLTQEDQQQLQYDHVLFRLDARGPVLNCPICSESVETLPKPDRNVARLTCCGHSVHIRCADACPTNTKHHCPLCRARMVVEGSKEDIRRLLHWVEQGKAWAQIILAARYSDGNGVPQSYTKAVELLMQAATVGSDPDAQFNLGCMYENGQGVEQSYECAADWYEMAIVSGNGIYPRAWFHIGVLYDCGDGFDQSFEKSRQCFSVAAAQGHSVAMDFIHAIEEGEKEKQAKQAEADIHVQVCRKRKR